MNRPFEGLYLHIPFCVKRCAYCDFPTNAVPRDSARIDDYLEQLVLSVELAGRAGLLDRVRTIYIGGGTPSFVGAARLRRLLETVGERVDLSQVVEFTMEANPDSFDEEVASAVSRLGVNRFSIGVQSTDDDTLRLLGRVHSGAQALEALRVAGEYAPKVSADIICGIMGVPHEPGETSDCVVSAMRARMLRSIGDVVAAGVNHVSVYPLTIEEGTPFERAIEAGDLPDVDEDEQAADMLAAASFLGAVEPQPFKRYEISNYALPGCESRHNTSYWTGVPYLGLGAGAASMFDAVDRDRVLESGALAAWGWRGDARDDTTLPGSRTADSAFPADPALRGGRTRIADCFEESLTCAQAAAEDFMLAMRLAGGIERSRLEALQNANPALREAERSIIQKGLAAWACSSGHSSSTDCLAPTERGWLLGNEMFATIWTAG